MAKKTNTKNRSKIITSTKDFIAGYPAWVAERSRKTLPLLKRIQLKKRSRIVWKKTIIYVERKPFTSFFALLVILFLLIFVGNSIRKPQQEKPLTRGVQTVTTYKIGEAPKVTVQAQVQKSGIIKIVALTPGIVSQINVVEGQLVTAGTNLLSLSSNYSGGNAASIQRQIADAQYSNVKNTYDTQKDIIQKQREIVDQNKSNTDKLKDITNQSITDTQNLVNLNNDILSTLNSNLQTLQNTNQNGSNDQLILGTKQQISQVQSGIAQLNAGLRQSQYQTNTDNPPQKLAELQHDIAIKQLDLQQKGLELSIQTSKLQLQLAQIGESMYYPSAPFDGTVERIFVNQGESVNPGTTLLILHGDQTVKIVAKVPASIAQKVSRVQASTLHINSHTIQQVPVHISSEATDGQLYSVLFSIPSEYQNDVTNSGFIAVNLAIGIATTTPLIPIDAVYQGQNNAYIFVNKSGVAKSQAVELGNVFGEYVEVKNGIGKGDQIILNRSVIEGDTVKKQ